MRGNFGKNGLEKKLQKKTKQSIKKCYFFGYLGKNNKVRNLRQNF